MAGSDINMVRSLLYWAMTLPFRLFFVVFAAFITLFVYYLVKLGDFQTREEGVLYLRDHIVRHELNVEMSDILSPAQYEFASNHIVNVIMDIATTAVDYTFVMFGVEPTTMQLATFVAMLVSFRLSVATFVSITAFLFFIVGIAIGRYKFHDEWKKNKVVEVSSTKFAIGWQSKVLTMWIFFVYLASPIPFYMSFAVIGTFGLFYLGYVLARSFTDHL